MTHPGSFGAQSVAASPFRAWPTHSSLAHQTRTLCPSPYKGRWAAASALPLASASAGQSEGGVEAEGLTRQGRVPPGNGEFRDRWGKQGTGLLGLRGSLELAVASVILSFGS